MSVYFNGLVLGLSLIMALGPQNIFLIRQGALRRHAALSAVTCFISDIILITLSVMGLQEILSLYPGVQVWMTWIGVMFLMYYGVKTFLSSLKPANDQEQSAHQLLSRRQIILLALGFSLLNPHAIIDSWILIGGGSSQFPGQEGVFLLGVISSSLLWFSVLTSLTYYFAHVLTRATVWRRVELFSSVLLFCLGAKLLKSALVL